MNSPLRLAKCELSIKTSISSSDSLDLNWPVTLQRCDLCTKTRKMFRQLHWLLIQKRICHKIISATHRSVYDSTPLYLSELLHRHTPALLAFSDQHLDLSLMLPGPGIPIAGGTASEVCRSIPLECPPREHQGGLH